MNNDHVMQRILCAEQEVEKHYTSFSADDDADADADVGEESGTEDSSELLPVTLDPSIAQDYHSVFYPQEKAAERAIAAKQRAAKKSLENAKLGIVKTYHVEDYPTTKKHFADLCQYLTDLSASTQAVLATCRWIVANTSLLQQKTPSEISTEVNEAVAKILSSISGQKESAFYSLISALNSGKNHIIRPSARYEGGMDVLFTGVPKFSNVRSTAVTVECPYTDSSQFPSSSSGYAYERAKGDGGQFNNKYSTAAIEVIRSLVHTTHENSHVRRTNVIPLTSNLHKVLKTALSTLNALGLKLGTDCPVCPPEFTGAFSKYFSIVIINEAHPPSVREKLRPVPGVHEHSLNLENILLSSTVGYSLAMHLPKKLVSFITQTPETEKPSMTALSMWVSAWSKSYLRIPAVRIKRDKSLPPTAVRVVCPKYVMTASRMKDINAARKRLGYVSESGRTNDDGIFCSPSGTLQFLPKSSELASDNAVAYEKVLEEATELAFAAGTPLAADQLGETNPVFGLISPDYGKKIAQIKLNLKKFAGTLQAFSWDYNCVLTTAKGDPEKLFAMNTCGSTVPGDQVLNDYLNKPAAFAFHLLFPHSTVSNDAGRVTSVQPDSFGAGSRSAAPMLKTSLFQNLFNMYTYLLDNKHVPDVQQLVEQAAKELNITKLGDPGVEALDYERGLYTSVMTADLKMTATSGPQAPALNQVRAIIHMLTEVLNDSGGLAWPCNLRRICEKNKTHIEDSVHYFHPQHMPLSDFKNVYSYLGGRVFYRMLRALLAVDKKVLMTVNVDSKTDMPDFIHVVRDIMPLATVLGKYVVDSAAIADRTRDAEETLVKDTSIGVSDIHVPGVDEGRAQLFPHQVGTHQSLRRLPKFAILDISPGGGKCCVFCTIFPSKKGILQLGEAFELSDGETDDEGFRPFVTTVMSHEGQARTDKAYKTFGKTLKALLNDGTEVEGLPEHKLYTLVDYDLEFVKLSELSVGDWLVKSLGTNLFPTKVPTIKGHGRLTVEMAKILGFMIAEGRVFASQCSFCNSDLDVLKKFKNCALNEFDKEDFRLEKPRAGHSAYNYHFKGEARTILTELCVAGHSADRQVPYSIRTSPKEYQTAFLAALFEGDGGIHKEVRADGKATRYRLSYASISKQLVFQVKAMLENIGVACKIQHRTAWATNGSENQVRGPAFVLAVEHTSMKLFKDEIGFISGAKQKLLEEAVAHLYSDKLQNTNIFAHGLENKIPGCEQFRELMSITDSLLSAFEYTVMFGNQTRVCKFSLRKAHVDIDLKLKKLHSKQLTKYNVAVFTKVIESLPQDIRQHLTDDKHFNRLYDFCLKCAASDWTRVVSIARGKKQAVYDISVPGPHSYAAMGIMSHNTIAVLTDVAALMRDRLIKKPLIIAPNGLVRNWVEDMHKVTGGKWNCIPVTTPVWNSAYWGDDRLTKLIQNAPPNTIVVVGMSVLTLKPYPLVIGNHAERCWKGLEFLKKFGFDYIAVDEAHRIKSMESGRHKVVKQLSTSSAVKFIRLATGTLISNRINDVVGQTAVMSAHVFRTPDEFKAQVELTIGKNKVLTKEDQKSLGKHVRERLSKFASVITYKRKEWAFMLPIPSETFFPVHMSEAHQKVYAAVLKETMDEITGDNELLKLMQGKDAEEKGDEKSEDKAVEIDAATEAELEKRLHYIMQRLEQIMTDPLGDPFGKIYFTALEQQDFVPEKIQKCIERIKLSFKTIPWVPGRTYLPREQLTADGTDVEPRSVVDTMDDGRHWVLMPDKNFKYTDKEYYAPYKSVKHPKDDPRWKEEPRGKVLVFCRYNRTTEAVFRALPPELKRIAATFCGTSGKSLEGRAATSKQDNLDAFKSHPWKSPEEAARSKTPSIQILIANEQAISEGHNLQVASRLIRLEMPWTPGELDQAQSRIFRPQSPDPKLGDLGKREVIYLDWIVTNNSMEVTKLSRLVAKMVEKAQFDESENPLYDVLNQPEYALQILPMKPEMFLALPHMSDINKPYLDAYKVFTKIQTQEFRLMRETRHAKMFDLEPEPMMKDSKILPQIPYIANLRIPDRNNFGLIPLNDYLSDPASPDAVRLANDPQLLKGMYAHTEIGNGTIIGVSLTRAKLDGSRRTIANVEVQLAGTGGTYEVYKGNPALIYLAPNLDEENIKNFAVDLNLSPEMQKQAAIEAEREARRLEREAEREARREADAEREARKDVDRQRRKAGKLYLEEEEEAEEDVDEDNTDIQLLPVMFNGQFAMEAVPSAGMKNFGQVMKKFGFSNSPRVAMCTLDTHKNFTAVINYLDSKYYISDAIYRRIAACEQSYLTGSKLAKTDPGRCKFKVQHAPFAELKNFYTMAHKATGIDEDSGKQELRVYPVVIDSLLMLNINLTYNPKFVPMLGKTIPKSTGVKFEEFGVTIKFYRNKNEILADIKHLIAQGFNVVNAKDARSYIKDMKVIESK